MDAAALQQALQGCGTCGHPEEAHQYAKPGQASSEEALILMALGGACTQFRLSPQAQAYQRALVNANGRSSSRNRWPRCGRCLLLHPEGKCQI